jgi:hypothetical protein
MWWCVLITPGRVALGQAVEGVPDKAVASIEKREAQVPLGLRAGVFEFYPAIEVSAVHTNNVEQSSSDSVAAAGLKVAPHLKLKTNWVRHEFNLEATGERIDFIDHPDAATTEGEVAGSLRIDIRRDTEAKIKFVAAQEQSAASASDVADTAIDKLNEYEFGVSGELSRYSGRFGGTIGAGLTRISYGDVKLAGGGKEDTADLNYLEPHAGFAVTYHGSSKVRPLIAGDISSRVYDLKTDEDGLERDSYAVSLKAGAQIESGRIWSATAGLQYAIRTYKDDALSDFSGFGFFANAVWRPSELTGIEFSVEPGTTAHAGEIKITHEFREYLKAQAWGSAEYSISNGVDDASLTLEWGGELSYRMGQTLWLLAGVDQTRYLPQGDTQGYSETQVKAGLRIAR